MGNYNMQRLELLIPPPIVAAVVALLMWLSHLYWPLFAWSMSVSGQFLLMGLLVLLAVIFGVGALLRFRTLHTTADPRNPHRTQQLAITGVYAYSRNPMYLGVYFLLLCWAIYLTNWAALVLSLLFVGFITRFQIIPEERVLQKMFGASYQHYCEKVRRWI